MVLLLALGAIVTVGVSRLLLGAVVETRTPSPVLVANGSSNVLVVAMHGLAGDASRQGLITLVHAAYPSAHIIAPIYLSGLMRAFSNQDPYEISDDLEVAIDAAFRTHHYDRIVLIGHSLGAELLRKAFVWAAGHEDDAPNVESFVKW